MPKKNTAASFEMDVDFKDITGVKGTKKQIKITLPTGITFSTFVSKEKYEKFKNYYDTTDDALKYHVDFLKENSGKGERNVMVYEIPDFGIKMRRYVTLDDYEKNEQFFGQHAKNGEGFGTVIWNLVKTLGPKVVEPLVNVAAPVIGQFLADKFATKKEGSGLDEPQLQEGQGIRGRGITQLGTRGTGVTQLGTRGTGGTKGEGIDDVLNGIAKFLNYNGVEELKRDFTHGPPLSTITNIASSLIKNNMPLNKFANILKDKGILPKTGNGSKITNASIFKHINKRKLKQEIKDIKREKRGGWIGPVLQGLAALAGLVGPTVIDQIGKLVNK